MSSTPSRKRPPKKASGEYAPISGKRVGAEMGGGVIVPADPCDIPIDIDLESVRAAGLRGLLVGAVLSVGLEQVGTYKSAICKRTDGVIVGALSSFTGLTQLISCLDKGVSYVVEVTHVGTGSCHVRGGRAR